MVGSLGKGNKAYKEANSTQHVNLGLAEMGPSKSAFFSPSENFSFFLEDAFLVIRSLWMSDTRPRIWTENSSFSHLCLDSRKNIHCIFAAARNILPVWVHRFIAMFNEWMAVVCLSGRVSMQTFSVKQGQSEPCWCLFKKMIARIEMPSLVKKNQHSWL